MDFDIISAIERVGFPVVIAIVGAILYWQASKQSAKRDESNATLLKGQIDILAKLAEDVHANKIADIEAKGSLHAVKEQITDESNGINGKLDLIPTQITKATNNATMTITQQMDNHHDEVLKVIGGIKDPITAIHGMFQELKKTQELAHAISSRIESALPTVTADISRIIREETKANDLQKIPIVNVNHNGADG